MKHNIRSVNLGQPAAPTGSSPRKRVPPRSSRKRTTARTPRLAVARPVQELEPIFEALVEELRFDPRDRL